jgi:hypothetical protein
MKVSNEKLIGIVEEMKSVGAANGKILKRHCAMLMIHKNVAFTWKFEMIP